MTFGTAGFDEITKKCCLVVIGISASELISLR